MLDPKRVSGTAKGFSFSHNRILLLRNAQVHKFDIRGDDTPSVLTFGVGLHYDRITLGLNDKTQRVQQVSEPRAPEIYTSADIRPSGRAC